MRESNELPHDSWLSLRQASEKMGVSFATLRAWADEGRIQSYRTPGGHRRFRVNANAAPFKMPVRRAEARWRLLERIAIGRVQLAREPSQPTPHDAAGEGAQTAPAERIWLRLPLPNPEQRDLERELIRLCTGALQHISQPTKKGEADLETRAETLGQAFGKLNWRYGISARQAALALGLVRNAFLESVVEFAFGLGEPNVDELTAWLRCVNEIVDAVSAAMLEHRAE